MNRTPKIVGVIAALLVSLLVVKVILARQVDDQKLISESLREAVKASREGKPGGVMDKLSLHMKVNGSEYESNRFDVSDFIRKSRPDIDFDNTRAVVTGDEAKIVSPARIQVDFLGQKMDRRIKEMTLTFRKEDDHEWLVIPVRKWKLSEVTAPPDAVNEFLQNN